MITVEVDPSAGARLVDLGDALSSSWSLAIGVALLLFVVGPLVPTLAGLVRAVEDLVAARRALALANAPLAAGEGWVVGTVTEALCPSDLPEHARPWGDEAVTSAELLDVAHPPLKIWREESRAVRAIPFVVRTERGERIRVEPGESLVLRAPIRRTTVVDDERRRTAWVGLGTRVAVHGVLRTPNDSGPYRSGGPEHVLGPPTGAPMIVGAEPLDERPAFWAATRGLLLLALLGLGGAELALLEARLGHFFVEGVAAIAQVREERSVGEGVRLTLLVEATAPGVGGHELEVVVPADAADRVRPGDWVSCIVDRSDDGFELAREPGIDALPPLVLPSLALAVLALGLVAASRGLRRWHERT